MRARLTVGSIIVALVAIALLALIIVTGGARSTAAPVSAPQGVVTDTPTNTSTATVTPTATLTATPTNTATATPTRTATATATRTATATNTATATRTATATVRPTTANYLPIVDVPFPTPTDTPSPTATPLPENTPTNTSVPPTATPTDTPYPPTEPPIPPPAAPCNLNAPAPAEGAQAWMTVTDPPRFSMTTLCVRLILNGQVIPGATVSAVAHYKTTNTNLGPATSGADGVGHITFSIGGAAAGYTVVVDAKAVFGGRTYTAQTSFTPQ